MQGKWLLATATVVGLAGLLSIGAAQPQEPLTAQQWDGRRVYRRVCAPCHGSQGDGKGLYTQPFFPKPRDLTKGVFKWRSTPSGSLPTDQDLFDTLTRGSRGTEMPSFKSLLSAEERWNVIAYIKSFSSRFSEEKPEEPISLPQEPPVTPESIARGKQVYQDNKCWECHGQKGKGDGPAAPTLKDDWNKPIQPFDFTRGMYRCGGKNKDIYRTFTTGLDGTPMPSYADSIPDENDRWALVYYCRSLERKRHGLDYLIHGNLD